MQPLGGTRSALFSVASAFRLSQPHRSFEGNMLSRFILVRGARLCIKRSIKCV